MKGFELTAEEMRLFLQESLEQLDFLEKALVLLEEEPNAQEYIQDAFRAAHTIKGGAAAAGFEDIASLTHAMESWLDLLRQGKEVMTRDLTDILLQGVDALRRCLEAVESDGGTGSVDIEHLIGQLQLSPSAEVEASTHSPIGNSNPKPLQGNQKLFRWKIAVDGACPMPSVRAYQAYLVLEECGEIVESRPTVEAMEKDGNLHSLEMLVALDTEPEELRRQLQQVADITVEYEELGGAGKAAPSNPPSSTGGGPRNAGTRGATVRIDVQLLDKLMNLAGELIIDRTRLTQVVHADLQFSELKGEVAEIAGHFSRITSDLQDAIMQARMIPLGSLFKKFPRMIRDLGRQLGKTLTFEVSGEETELDRSVIEQIGDPLIHLLRNAVDHGLESPEERKKAGKQESGLIRLSAYHRENHIYIEVHDDGKGLDPDLIKKTALARGLMTEEQLQRLNRNEILELLFVPGFSTASSINSVSGRGVGMDVVKRNIEKVNGTISFCSEVGYGTTWTIRLPLTLAIVQSLMVRLKETTYAIPMSSVLEVLRVEQRDLESVNDKQVIRVRDTVVPLVDLEGVWGGLYSTRFSDGRTAAVVVLQTGLSPLGLVVDRVLGEQEIVIKNMGPIIGDVPGISGASILGDGRVALILDVVSLSREVKSLADSWIDK